MSDLSPGDVFIRQLRFSIENGFDSYNLKSPQTDITGASGSFSFCSWSDSEIKYYIDSLTNFRDSCYIPVCMRPLINEPPMCHGPYWNRVSFHDFSIVLNSKMYNLHRAFFVDGDRFSLFIRSVFQRNTESIPTLDLSHIIKDNSSLPVFECALDFFYYHDKEVSDFLSTATMKDLLELFKIADCLSCPNLLHLCASELSSKFFSTSHLVQVLNSCILSTPQLDLLASSVIAALASNFDKILIEDLISMPLSALRAIISHPELRSSMNSTSSNYVCSVVCEVLTAKANFSTDASVAALVAHLEIFGHSHISSLLNIALDRDWSISLRVLARRLCADPAFEHSLDEFIGQGINLKSPINDTLEIGTEFEGNSIVVHDDETMNVWNISQNYEETSILLSSGRNRGLMSDYSAESVDKNNNSNDMGYRYVDDSFLYRDCNSGLPLTSESALKVENAIDSVVKMLKTQYVDRAVHLWHGASSDEERDAFIIGVRRGLIRCLHSSALQYVNDNLLLKFLSHPEVQKERLILSRLVGFALPSLEKAFEERELQIKQHAVEESEQMLSRQLHEEPPESIFFNENIKGIMDAGLTIRDSNGVVVMIDKNTESNNLNSNHKDEMLSALVIPVGNFDVEMPETFISNDFKVNINESRFASKTTSEALSQYRFSLLTPISTLLSRFTIRLDKTSLKKKTNCINGLLSKRDYSNSFVLSSANASVEVDDSIVVLSDVDSNFLKSKYDIELEDEFDSEPPVANHIIKMSPNYINQTSLIRSLSPKAQGDSLTEKTCNLTKDEHIKQSALDDQTVQKQNCQSPTLASAVVDFDEFIKNNSMSIENKINSLNKNDNNEKNNLSPLVVIDSAASNKKSSTSPTIPLPKITTLHMNKCSTPNNCNSAKDVSSYNSGSRLSMPNRRLSAPASQLKSVILASTHQLMKSMPQDNGHITVKSTPSSLNSSGPMNPSSSTVAVLSSSGMPKVQQIPSNSQTKKSSYIPLVISKNNYGDDEDDLKGSTTRHNHDSNHASPSSPFNQNFFSFSPTEGISPTPLTQNSNSTPSELPLLCVSNQFCLTGKSIINVPLQPLACGSTSNSTSAFFPLTSNSGTAESSLNGATTSIGQASNVDRRKLLQLVKFVLPENAITLAKHTSSLIVSSIATTSTSNQNNIYNSNSKASGGITSPTLSHLTTASERQNSTPWSRMIASNLDASSSPSTVNNNSALGSSNVFHANEKTHALLQRCCEVIASNFSKYSHQELFSLSPSVIAKVFDLLPAKQPNNNGGINMTQVSNFALSFILKNAAGSTDGNVNNNKSELQNGTRVLTTNPRISSSMSPNHQTSTGQNLPSFLGISSASTPNSSNSNSIGNSLPLSAGIISGSRMTTRRGNSMTSSTFQAPVSVSTSLSSNVNNNSSLLSSSATIDGMNGNSSGNEAMKVDDFKLIAKRISILPMNVNELMELRNLSLKYGCADLFVHCLKELKEVHGVHENIKSVSNTVLFLPDVA